MRLIVILICLGLEQFFGVGPVLRCYSWVDSYLALWQQALQKVPALQQPWIKLAIAVIPIIVIIGLVQWLLCGRLYGLLSLLYATAILLYCLGPRDLRQQFRAYQAAVAREDQVAAQQIAKEILGNTAGMDPAAIHHAITVAVLTQANQRLFAVLFWFVVLGAWGAALYRLIVIIKEVAAKNSSPAGDLARPAELVQAVLDWVPVRLVTLTYALAGDFMAGFAGWWRKMEGGLNSNNSLLLECGLAALGQAKRNQAADGLQEPLSAVELIERTLIIWVVFYGLVVIAVWIF